MREIIVFLGPTLSINEASTILPCAYYLPPVRCGDIIRATRLNPRILAIIDGVFESSAAVWHKEILYAIEKGIIVLGASSMGALRARELKEFGMIGVGEVTTQYFQSLNDDDEVAVLHSQSDSNFTALSESMVNIRATLFKALDLNIIDKKTYNIIENSAKKLFFHQRTFAHLLQVSIKEGACPSLLKKFNMWVDQNGMVDIKKRDAISLLHTLAKSAILKSKLNKEKLHRSIFFRTLHKHVMCRPATSYQSWLPIQEKVALMSRYLGTTYRQTRRLAYLLSACYALAQKNKIRFNNNEIENLFLENKNGLNLSPNLLKPKWLEENDCNEYQRHLFFCRFGFVKKLFETIQQQKISKNTHVDYLVSLMRLSITQEYKLYKYMLYETTGHNDNQESIIQLFKLNDPIKYYTFFFTACLWYVIDQIASQLSLNPSFNAIQIYGNIFRRKHKLFSNETLNKWLAENGLNYNEYLHLMTITTRFNYLILQNNLDSLGIKDNEEDVWWLQDALRLTGVYTEAKYLYYHPNKIKEIQSEFINHYCSLDEIAFELDFINGEIDFLQNPLVINS